MTTESIKKFPNLINEFILFCITPKYTHWVYPIFMSFVYPFLVIWTIFLEINEIAYI
jgi:hypothetical protein